MGIKNIVKRIGNKAGNRIATLSKLSTGQVESIQLQRENYLLEEPKADDETARIRTERMMSASSIEIFNAYLSQIKELYLPMEKDAEYGSPFDPSHNIRYFKINKWVHDKKENNLEKLVNVYDVLSNEPCNIALIFNRTKTGTNVYLAVVNTDNDDNNVNADLYKSRLTEAIRGNFPGAEWDGDGTGILPCMDNDTAYSVATASNIPTEKSEKFISQTIEKLLDGIVPQNKKQEYTVVLLATPILDIEERKLKLGEFYYGLSPYASWQTDYHRMDNEAVGSSATVGVNLGASAGIQNGTNYSTTGTDSVSDNTSTTDTQSQSDTDSRGESRSDSESSAHSDGTTTTDTTTTGTSGSEGTNTVNTTGTTDTHSQTDGTYSGKNVYGGVSGSLGIGGGIHAVAKGDLQSGVGINAGGGANWGKNSSTGESLAKSTSLSEGTSSTRGWSDSTSHSAGKTAMDTLTKGITNTVSNTVAKTTGTAVANTLGRAVTKAMATTSGIAKSFNFGANFGTNFARSSTVTTLVGKNEGIVQTYTNYNIKHALELLESQMKRLEQSSALGMWDFAAYVISEDQNIANNVAHSYLALTLGEESYMSNSAINLWRNVEGERDVAKEIISYIRELRHPVFALNPEVIGREEDFNAYPSIVTATTSLSGKELAYSLNFPQKSIAGLPVLECAEFGRNVVTYDAVRENEKHIRLGKIFHMNRTEENTVDLSLNSLASHTFVTGSTGAGKSNTIYSILDKSREKGVKFLVVEPAKGEYKNVFGRDKDVTVYGTNPLISRMLRINPFSFPKNIHILEHLDRLVEIFNVCWPMYAAMPAVLKSAIEKSYKDCGWDLVRSVNRYDDSLYPEFSDVARNIRIIIESSEYDTDNKGAYKGSLLTRLQSLTTGINGLIFTSDELPEKLLFDENVIIDLSRVGSSETKALIMGMLVLKLQEYRMTSATVMNSELRHITVLEEAHNLLRRTSTQQSDEGSNLLGKSVEMLANAIAEMRTYGEGFVIADQAPGLMDMSVIRNTNTKIIMRLPDQSDRELVGKSASLDDDQIRELAKLPCGVAAVYQNEWVQPVLCKMERFGSDYTPYEYKPDSPGPEDDGVSDSLLKHIMDRQFFHSGDKEDLRELKHKIIRSELSTIVKVEFLDYLESDDNGNLEALGKLVYDFFDADEAADEARKYDNIEDLSRAVTEKLKPSVKGYGKEQVDLVVGLVLYEKSIRDPDFDKTVLAYYENTLRAYDELYRKGGKLF